jgi:hypothetical protein
MLSCPELSGEKKYSMSKDNNIRGKCEVFITIGWRTAPLFVSPPLPLITLTSRNTHAHTRTHTHTHPPLLSLIPSLYLTLSNTLSLLSLFSKTTPGFPPAAAPDARGPSTTSKKRGRPRRAARAPPQGRRSGGLPRGGHRGGAHKLIFCSS